MHRQSMNHCYRLVWNTRLGAWVAAPETTKGRSKGGKRLLAMAALLAPIAVLAGPTGGTVTSGAATISQSGATTNIHQSSQNASINWQGFSVAGHETVNFNQPNASAITLNRVIGNERSVIDGALNANGQVFLINSNGVLFSRGSSVNVGGLVASTRNISDADFQAGKFVFEGSGNGSVINLGTITTKDGGYAALLGNGVSNQGVIVATKGTVAMSAGDRISLNFNGDSLVGVTIDQGTLDALAENRQAILADGGTVLLTAKAANDLLGAQVNNGGLIQARTIGDLTGHIELFAHGGTANVDGTLDASASQGGHGGFIETSGDVVKVAASTHITTAAPQGQTGTWLIDPTDFTIGLGAGSQTASGIGVDTLTRQLANTAVSIATSAAGSGNGDIFVNAGLGAGDGNVTTNGLPNSLTLTAAGDIHVNAPIHWDANTLTLNAGKNVFMQAMGAGPWSPGMVGSGTARFVMNHGTGTNADGTPMGIYNTLRGYGGSLNPITFTGTGGVSINGEAYTVITDAAGLAAINGNPSGNFVLGQSFWAGSLANNLGTFSGKFNGFGNTLSASLTGTGLFEEIGANGVVSNLMASASISQPGTISTGSVGGIANVNRGAILNSASSGSINFTSAPVLGDGVSTVYSGGLVGTNHGLIAQSFASGTVNATHVAGGLVGRNAATGVIRDSAFLEGNLTSNAAVTTVGYVGGLVGVNAGRIQTSYTNRMPLIHANSTGATTGGLVGWNQAGGVIDQSYAMHSTMPVAATNTDKAAGFVWTNDGTITNAYAIGMNMRNIGTGVPLTNRWTSAFAYSNSGTIDGAYALSAANPTSTDGSTLCGFSCSSTGTIRNAYWSSSSEGAAPLAADSTAAKSLTAAQAAVFSSYAGFDPSVWAASMSGHPVLGNILVYVSPAGSLGASGNPYYGDVTSDAATLAGTNQITVLGLQGGGGDNRVIDNMSAGVFDPATNTVRNLFALAAGSTGYVNAGAHSASINLSSSVYRNIRGGFVINRRPLQLSPDVVSDKVYDGTTQGNVNNGLANGGLTGLVGNQTLGVDWSGLDAVAYDTANAGNGKGVSLIYSDLSAILSDGANGGLAGNYTVVGTAATKTAHIFVNSERVYWNTATQAYDLPHTQGTGAATRYFNPETGAYDRTSNYNGPLNNWYWNQGGGKFDIAVVQIDNGVRSYYNPVTDSYQATAYTGPNKYFQIAAKGNITPKQLTADFLGNDKTYDGSTAGSVSGGTLAGIVGNDAVSLDTALMNATFADANAGDHKNLTVAGLALTGANAGNYTIGQQTTTANITPLVLQLGGVKAADGSTQVAGSNLIAVNLVSGDALNFSGTATLVSGAAGNQMIGNTSGLSIDNPNYTLNGASGSVTVGGRNQVVAQIHDGAATVTQSGNTTTVNQSADHAVIDWLRFSIGADETVRFVQPSSSAVVLNRVIGNERSLIEGALQANGRVFILNSNGVLFRAGSSVNVGALVASTLSMSKSDFDGRSYVFVAKGGSGSVVAEGDIVIADGGFIALASGNGVTHAGSLRATHGTAVLASADQLALDLSNTDAGLNGYAVQALRGTTSVGGTLSMADGLLETAGAAVSPASGLSLNTGVNGTWSYSLPNVQVGGSNSNVAASFVNQQLAQRNFSLNAIDGDLRVSDAIGWSADTTLGLGARHDVHIDNAIRATGDRAGLALAYGGDYHIRTRASYAGATLDAEGKPIARQDDSGGVYGSVTLSGANAHLSVNGQNYTLIHSMDQLDALDMGNSQNGMYFNPVTGLYDVPIADFRSGSVAGTMYMRSGNNYYNSATGAYDIPATTVVGGVTMHYNLDTGAYDLTSAYSGDLINAFNAQTGRYDIRSRNTVSGKHWDPATGTFSLDWAYYGAMVYNQATDKYDIVGLDMSTGYYYDPATGGLTSADYLNYDPSFFNVATGVYDRRTPHTLSGHYALAGDLDATGRTYLTAPIESFSGTLAGLGHTINGLTIETPASSPNGVGLIGKTADGSGVRDLGLTNVDVRATIGTAVNGTNGSGAALVGMAEGTEFRNVYVTGQLDFTQGSSGAVAGWARNSSFTNTFAELNATRVTGGLAGRVDGGVVENSHVRGTLGYAVGGLLGSFYDTGTLAGHVANSYFMGTHAAQGATIAKDGSGNVTNADIINGSGLLGGYNTSNAANGVFNSFSISNLGNTDPYPTVGGLMGGMSMGTVENSYWQGAIHAFNIATTNMMIVSVKIGGLIGSAGSSNGTGTVTIDRSWAQGRIKAEGTSGGLSDRIGGLIGEVNHRSSGAGAYLPDVISNSWADVDIDAGGTGIDYVGGLLGSAKVVSIRNSHASGNLVGDHFVGGLIGVNQSFQYTDASLGRPMVPSSEIDSSYFSGTVSGGDRMGALVGSAQNVNINNSYWSDAITAPVAGQGLVRSGQVTGGTQALSAETFSNGDIQYHLNGTIDEVLAGRAAAEAAAQAEAQAQASFLQSARQAAAGEVARAHRAAAPTQVLERQQEEAARAQGESLDRNIVVAERRSFSANIRRIEVDGEVFLLEGDQEEETKP